MADLSAAYVERQGQIVIVDTESGRDLASCMVFRYGDRWQMFNIRGRAFTAAWPQMWAVCRERGCNELSGYVTPPHARMLRIAAKIIHADIEIGPPTKTGDMGGKEYCWVIARPMAGY